MAFTTVNDLIALAFRDSGIVGVGQTASAEDMNDAFNRVNMMLSQWQRKRWLIWHLVTTGLTMTGAQSYTVGTGGSYNIPRPDKIESAFFRQLNVSANQPDYPLEIIEAREDYNLITLKTLEAFPQYLFYDSDFPLGRIYPWPVPQANIYAVHITTKAVLSQFTSLVQTISLPPEYYAAIFYNLCRRLMVGYGRPPDPEVNALAKDALNVVRTANAQIPRLHMPDALRNRSKYNVYSDTY